MINSTLTTFYGTYNVYKYIDKNEKRKGKNKAGKIVVCKISSLSLLSLFHIVREFNQIENSMVHPHNFSRTTVFIKQQNIQSVLLISFS